MTAECPEKISIIFSAGISYDRAYEGFLKRAYNDADRQEIADKLKKENLIRRYQQGEMQRTFQYRRSVEGQEPVWVSMTVHIYMEPATGNLELFPYAYDITRRMRNENISKIIFENTFNSIALIHVREKTLDLIRKSPNTRFTNMPQNMGYDEFVALIKRTFILSEEMRDFFRTDFDCQDCRRSQEKMDLILPLTDVLR